MFIRHMLVASLVFILAVFPKCGFCMDGLPPSLDTLVANSDHIVCARVSHVFPEPNGVSATARLEVESYIKGPRESKQIDVVFYPTMICPAPARLRKDERVLAFIKSQQRKFVVPFGHHGTKVIPDKELNDLINRIRAIVPAKTLDTKELRRIDQFVGHKVSITGHYSSDTALNGLNVLNFIPVRFTNRIQPPNGHEVTVTGHLHSRGSGNKTYYRIDDAIWKYPPGQVKIHSSIFEPEPILPQGDPFRSDEP